MTSKKDFSIHVEHLTRVEGHGNIILDVKNGAIQQVQWQVSEAPRFFEAMLRGQHYHELRPITSRICGICSIGHSLASLKATEDALGLQITPQTGMLRRLAINAENMQSHILHIGYLAAPDLFGVGSVFPLIGGKHTDAVLKIVWLHRLANEMSDLICGRTIHPIRLIVGGFSALPTPTQLTNLRKRLEEGQTVTQQVADIIHGVADRLPTFTRETEYIALSTGDEYAFYDGNITSTDTGVVSDPLRYPTITNEYVVPQSTAKYTKHHRDSYMVGALARFNNNSSQLHPKAKHLAQLFHLNAINYNPFMNTIAQLVEYMHNIEDSIHLIDALLDGSLKEEKPVKAKPKAGRGVGLVEVPRGLLIHDYTLNAQGYCTKANCVIPTNQNHANIQKDMEKLVPEILDQSPQDIELTLEMLVRAYDPCISCSTHYLTVTFI
ncbi:MAG: Ni/Fe hydrogenase subunit alpha [Candidatus Thermoplasmatota archaeon]|nr:Ni/Fe hydrogenase subunit alpha [Candidatus Thermoplasmatota archaeon]